MFEHSLLGVTHTKTKYSVLASLFLQSMMVGIAMLIPLICTGTLPARQLRAYIGPPPPPPAPRTPLVKIHEAPRPKFDQGRLTAPTKIPRKIAIIEDSDASAPALVADTASGIPGGVPGGSYSGVIADLLSAPRIVTPPPLPPPEPPKRSAIPRIKVGGEVQSAKQVYAPLPVYPPLARQARISGVVKLSAIISADGTVQQLTAVSGHPLLVPAALQAVSQWRYRPTLLNGVPVEVLTQIDVNFTLR